MFEDKQVYSLSSMKRLLPVALGLFCVCIAIGAGIILGISGGPEKPTGQRVIDIPAGAALQVRKDPDSQIVPSAIKARVGERLIIKNRDRQTHQVGPFTIKAGQTLEYPLTKPGLYEGICTLRPGKRFTLTVVN